MQNKLIIPPTARISWNTIEDKIVQRDNQESIFLATFDDIPSDTKHKHQIDYSYYSQGRYYEDAPKFVLHIYSFGSDLENYSDTTNYFDKQYDGLDDAIEDINFWLNFFHIMTKKATATKKQKASTSTLSLHLTFRKETPQYVLDFFLKGVKSEELPTILYRYDFKFKNKPNYSGKTTMFFEKKKGRYYLNIYHKFDFHTEAAEGYWFVGGLAQYAENDDLAGYIKHTHGKGMNQVFGFKDQLCLWGNGIETEQN
jgi:hypothetical protein